MTQQLPAARKPGMRAGLSRCLFAALCGFLAPLLVAATHDYHLTIDRSLEMVRVEAQLADAGLWLSAARGGSNRLSTVSGCAGESVERRRGALRSPGRCLRYAASMKPAAQRSGRHVASIQVGHEYWLWLPELDDGDIVRITLTMPDGVQAFVPWRRTGADRYELRASPGSGDALARFGEFRESSLPIRDSVLSLTILEPTLDEDRMTRWLTEAAGLVAEVGGQFPNPGARVVVERGETSLYGDSVVPFGHVMRSGEEVVRFFVKPGATLEELRADWTAVHEFSHLLLPYIQDEQKWVSEGFASYYQNVLLARGGIYTEIEAWQRLSRSFSSASQTRNPSSPNDTASRSFWEMRMLIYWSGAALALMTDVELRRQSDGRQSLDTVLGKLAVCCLPSGKTWQGRELFEKFDALSGTSVFTQHFDRYADSPGMPPYAQALALLGVRSIKGRVTLDEDAPLASIRRAIMQRRR